MGNRLAAMIGVVVVGSAVMSANGQATQPAGEFRPGGYPETFQGAFYPGTELRALPGARANAMVAAAEFRRAQSNLDNSISEIRRAFNRSPQLQEAMAEEQAAFEQLSAARARALEGLKQDAAYQSARDLKNRLGEQIEDSKRDKTSTAQSRMAMATVKLTYATSASAMEAAAMANDPSVAEARRRLVAAGRRLSQLYQDFDEAVRTSPNVLAARKMVEDTRIAAVGADALYVEARNVASVAVDYAYYLYDRPQPYVYNNAPAYGGYGYPIRLGYPIGYPTHYPYRIGGGPGR